MKNFLTITIFFLITSCFNQIETRGYVFELSDYKLIKEGISGKDFVLEAMGNPTFTIDHDVNQELWIYFSEDIQKFLFFKPDILNRKIMILTFDNHGTVKKIGNYDLKNQNNISFSNDYTKVDHNQKEGIFSELFNNIGQVKPN